MDIFRGPLCCLSEPALWPLKDVTLSISITTLNLTTPGMPFKWQRLSDWIENKTKARPNYLPYKKNFNYKDTNSVKVKKIKRIILCKRKNKKSEVANEHMKRCSPSLIIREMQIKTTARHYFTFIKMAAIKNKSQVLAGVAQWTERLPVNRRVIGLVPSQGTCLGYIQARSPVGGALEATTHWCSSPSLSPCLSLSKNQ